MSKKLLKRRLSKVTANVLPLAVSGGFGTQNYQTKTKVK